MNKSHWFYTNSNLLEIYTYGKGDHPMVKYVFDEKEEFEAMVNRLLESGDYDFKIMSEYLTDQWEKATDEMQDFFAEMDAKIAKGKKEQAEIEADARLIAAAPELLKSIQILLDALSRNTGEGDTIAVQVAKKNARAAIAKANGE